MNGFEIQDGILIKYTGTDTDVIIPEGVTSIGKYAFSGSFGWGNQNLQSVVIPEGVTSIGNDAFLNCKNLHSVTVPESVTSIGNSAWKNCQNLQNITIPDDVTFIGDGAFLGCNKLTDSNEMIIVKNILFGYYGKETNVIIPDGITAIGCNAFYGCANLQSVTIPCGVVSVGEYAFCGCANLQSVTLPDSLTSIGDYAFLECKNLQNINFPASLISIGEGAFRLCNRLADTDGFVIVGNILFNYFGNETNVAIPDNITLIGKRAFYDCLHLKNITLPNSVTAIESEAFSGCANLQSLTISDGVSFIGKGAFAGCRSLQNIIIPDSVKTIGESAFSACAELKSVILSNAVTAIADNTFHKCLDLQSITIPSSVTSIGENAWKDCRSLQSVIISDGVTSIGRNAFDSCTNLQNITLPDSVTFIGYNAFYRCRGLQSVTLPAFLTSISYCAFSGCGNLTEIVIPNSVTTISAYAFSSCQNLLSVKIPDSVTAIGDCAFEYCSNLQDMEIPDSIQSILQIFGNAFPDTLLHKIHAWYPRMTDNVLKQYVLTAKTWNALDTDTQTEIFAVKQSKALMKVFLTLITETHAENIAAYYLKKMKSALPANECKKIAAFITNFHDKLSDDALKALYKALKAQKNGKKPAEELGKDPILASKLSKVTEAPKNLSETEKKLLAVAEAHNLSNAQMEATLKEYYALTVSDIPTVMDTEGNSVLPIAVLYLLTAHETMGDFEVIAQYEKNGISPEVAEIVALLDPDSLQSALRELADKHLGLKGYSKKMCLAYPICRYADEALMEDLVQKSSSWNTPAFSVFRDASIYSESRVALLFAEKYNNLDKFASVRGTTADLLRDHEISDMGLSSDGTKTYALGNQTVTAVLQKDLTFLVRLENGKTAKSLPKKGANPDLYAAANTDFSAMKKNAKKIVKNRQNRLFVEFLHGKSRSADEWKTAYTENPLLRAVASLLVWEQEKNTFILTAGGAVNAAGKSYEISKTNISLAHPMEMNKNDLEAWQKYFVSNKLKQPFEQIWEPVIDPNSIKEDRYKDCMIPYYRFMGKEKHGITVTDLDFHNEISIYFADCLADVERIDFESHYIAPEHNFEVKKFSFKKYTRMTNHIAAYLDRITMYDRIAKDDISVEAFLPSFTLAQITEFIRIATEKNCANVTALLLEYKNKTFPDFDPFEAFSLDFNENDLK